MNLPTVANRLELIKTLPAGAILAEIGVNRAEFSNAILCNTQVGRIYLIDPWKPYFAGVQAWTKERHDESYVEACRIARQHGPRAVIVRQTSELAALNNISIPLLDAVYIDADHRYESVLQDLILWSKRLKPGGVLMGHDYIHTPESTNYAIDVVRAVADFCKEHGWQVTALTDELFSSFRLERR